MHPVTITEACLLTKKSRATIYRAIKSGKLSARLGDDGEKRIDVADLLEVYGALKGSLPNPESDDETHDVRQAIRRETVTESHGLNGERVRYEDEITFLKERIAFLEGEFVAFRQREERLIDILDRKLLPAPAPTTPKSPPSAETPMTMEEDLSAREDGGGGKVKKKRSKKGKKKGSKRGKKRG